MSWVFLIVPIHGSYCHVTSRPLSFFFLFFFLFFYFFRFCAFLGILGGVPGFLGGVPGFLGAVPGFRWCSGFLDVPVFREVLHAVVYAQTWEVLTLKNCTEPL